MIEEEPSADGLDFEALRYAIEKRDADALLGFYSDDAKLRIVNSDAPASPAFELRGRGQIERYLHAVCEQEVECIVLSVALQGERAIAFVEECRYPDGVSVWVEAMLELRGGLIVRHVEVVGRARTEGGEG